MSEAGVQSRFLKWANARGDTIARNCGAGTPGHVNGDPDCYGTTASVPWVLEFKRKGQKPSRLQIYRLSKWASVGCAAAWFDDIRRAKEWIHHLAFAGGYQRKAPRWPPRHGLATQEVHWDTWRDYEP